MKYLSLLAVSILLLSSSASALTYDSVSNTYKDDTPQQSTTSTETTTEPETTPQQIVEIETTPEIEEVTSDTRWYYGSLASLHQLLDQYNDQLQDHIANTYQWLQEDIATSTSTVTLQQRLDVLQCVWVIDDEFKIVEDIKTTQKQLRTKVRLVVTDTHSEMEALETKIEENLLEQFEENLEIAIVQNKVESILNEYTNVINTYYDLSQDEILQLEEDISSNNSAYEAVLNNYDARVEKLEDLEEVYSDFTKKSSFVWVVVWPSLWEVLAAIDEIKRYYRIKFMAEWSEEVGTRVTTDSITYQNQARTRFNRAFSEYIDTLINDLYPLEDLERINQEMLTIRAAYLQDNGELDCRGLATNPTIDKVSETLTNDMKELLISINSSANQVKTDTGKLPTTTKELQKQLLEYAQWFTSDEQGVLIRDEAIRVQAVAWVSRSTNKIRTSESKWSTTVRDFLLTQYETATVNNKLTRFESKLNKALQKIEVALPKAEWTAKKMIEVIQAVIREFV